MEHDINKPTKSGKHTARDYKMMAVLVLVALVFTGRVVALEIDYHANHLADMVVAANTP